MGVCFFSSVKEMRFDLHVKCSYLGAPQAAWTALGPFNK